MTIVASECGRTLGVRAFFGRAYFPEMLARDGSAGARQIIWRHRAHAIDVPFPEGKMDWTRPADYARLQETFRELPPSHRMKLTSLFPIFACIATRT